MCSYKTFVFIKIKDNACSWAFILILMRISASVSVTVNNFDFFKKHQSTKGRKKSLFYLFELMIAIIIPIRVGTTHTMIQRMVQQIHSPFREPPVRAGVGCEYILDCTMVFCREYVVGDVSRCIGP